jgi:hypothetical protein
MTSYNDPGLNPLSYTGVRANNPPNVIQATRAPASTDLGYQIGTLWINTSTQASYQLDGFSAGSAVWVILGGGSSDVNTINTLPPTGGNITIAGTAAQIGVANAGSTVTLSLIGPYTPATYTAHGVLIGEGASSVVATAAGTTGQVLIGSTGADPAFGALGLNSGLTAHGVLLGENNSAIVASAAGTNGQVFLGSTGADPAFGTLTTSTGVAYTTGAAALAIDVKNGGYAVVDQSSGSATLVKQTSYVTDNGASLVTYTLPLAANAAQGNVYQITGGSAGGWTLAQNASQTIHLGTQNTTTGTSGSLSSNGRYASVTLQCINATGLDFVVIASTGNFTVV